jgi:hypothetical protein
VLDGIFWDPRVLFQITATEDGTKPQHVNDVTCSSCFDVARVRAFRIQNITFRAKMEKVRGHARSKT